MRLREIKAEIRRLAKQHYVSDDVRDAELARASEYQVSRYPRCRTAQERQNRRALRLIGISIHFLLAIWTREHPEVLRKMRDEKEAEARKTIQAMANRRGKGIRISPSACNSKTVN